MTPDEHSIYIRFLWLNQIEHLKILWIVSPRLIHARLLQQKLKLEGKKGFMAFVPELPHL
jgi:hypothetical protein